MYRATTLAVALVLAVGCSGANSNYCDGTHPCADARWPRCDYATHTCMPADDGGSPDGPQVDAPLGDADSGDTHPGDAGCGSSAACTDPAAPICAGGDCRGCHTPAECEDRDSATPACNTAGRCVQCAESDDCMVANRPICGTETCRACQNGTECAARNASLPACHPNGSCVECRQHADCAGKIDTPACDLATSTCVPCTSDDQCSYFCELTNGRCVTDGEIVFVDGSAVTCTGGHVGVGTLADPYCQISSAVTNLGLRKYIHVGVGSYGPVSVSGQAFRLGAVVGAKIHPMTSSTALAVAGNSTVDVRGLHLEGATGTGIGVVVQTSANLSLRNLRLEKFDQRGISCISGTLLLDGVEVLSNKQGGIDLNTCTATIINSVIAKNGATDSPFGGVKITSPGAGSSFVNNTVVDNKAVSGAAGVKCASASTISNSVIWWNTPLDVVVSPSPECTIGYSNLGASLPPNLNAAPSFVNAASGDYHYMQGSAGIDAAGPGAPVVDFDGYPRPYNGTSDMGAFEWHP